MRVTDPAMVRSLLRDDAAGYLAPFLHGACSVSEAAGLLHVSLPKMHYWTRSLYDAGVLDVVEVQQRKGRAIKRYRAIADEFVIPAEALPEGYFARAMRRSNAAMTHALAAAAPDWVIAGDYRISASSPVRGSRARVARAGVAVPAPAHQSGCVLRITPAQARELIGEITALCDRWIRLSQDDSELPMHQLDLALAPIPE